MKKALIALLLLVFAVYASAAGQADACRAAIPLSLQKHLEAMFPGERLPFSSDAGQEVIDGKTHNSVRWCPLIASGDFNGDGRADYALLLITKVMPWHIRLIVATATKSSWSVRTLWVYRSSSLGEYYLETIPPGHYRSLFEDGEDGEAGATITTPEMTSSSVGFILGLFGSGYDGYFLKDGQWFRLKLTD